WIALVRLCVGRAWPVVDRVLLFFFPLLRLVQRPIGIAARRAMPVPGSRIAVVLLRAGSLLPVQFDRIVEVAGSSSGLWEVLVIGRPRVRGVDLVLIRSLS